MKKRCLAIIPARGGSKRIPYKNIKQFAGKPIIAYSINAAQQSCIFDEIMVSTDDHAIASVAQNYGASVPFLRSAECSNDYAGIAEVLEEVVIAYKNRGSEFDVLCCILATAPFINAQRLIDAYMFMQQSHVNAVIPVTTFHYPIQRALTIKNNQLEMLWPENYTMRSQDLEPTYHDVGQFYFIKTDVLMSEKKLFVSHTLPLILSGNESQDIDTESDWRLAELKYQLLRRETA